MKPERWAALWRAVLILEVARAFWRALLGVDPFRGAPQHPRERRAQLHSQRADARAGIVRSTDADGPDHDEVQALVLGLQRRSA